VINRWKGDSLQRAMDKSECFYDGCGSIKKQAMSDANKCTVKDFVNENIDGCKFSPPSQETSTPSCLPPPLPLLRTRSVPLILNAEY
jgi:hypothetical protein